MDRSQEKTTVPYPPVGADGGQSLSQKPNQSIAEEQAEHKPQERDFREILRQIDRVSDPAYLPSLSMNELYEKVYPGKPPVVEGLLYPGVYLFVGAPKVGKSFLMAQLAYHVSKGLPLWGYEVRQGAVLYLALEDDYPRLQGRLYRMFGEDSAADLHLSIYAKQLNSGLEEQLNRFVREHPDTRLIIIDTLQKIREAGAEKYSYADDYKVITSLKRFADGTGVCLLLVHHTRKQQADDKFDMISGTNGLMGAADGAFLLQKERRTDSAATLDISGRDLQDQRPLSETGQGAACVGVGAAGNGTAQGAARPGFRGRGRSGDGGVAQMEWYGRRPCCRPGEEDESQCLGYAAECPGRAAVL